MKASLSDSDFFERFEVVLDQDAEPADLDQVLAEFLLNYVRSNQGAVEVTDLGGADTLDSLRIVDED